MPTRTRSRAQRTSSTSRYSPMSSTRRTTPSAMSSASSSVRRTTRSSTSSAGSESVVASTGPLVQLLATLQSGLPKLIEHLDTVDKLMKILEASYQSTFGNRTLSREEEIANSRFLNRLTFSLKKESQALFVVPLPDGAQFSNDVVFPKTVGEFENMDERTVRVLLEAYKLEVPQMMEDAREVLKRHFTTS